MLSLYFGNSTAVLALISILIVLVFIGLSIKKRNNIQYWGRRVCILFFLGLFVCCVVATRDQYDKSVQALIQGVAQIPGTFPLISATSIQSNVCAIGGGLLALFSFLSIWIKKQSFRKVAFFIMSVIFIGKVFIIEITRIGLM